MSYLSQFDVVDSVMDAQENGFTLWGIPVQIAEIGGLPVSHEGVAGKTIGSTRSKRRALRKVTSDGIALSTIEALKTLDPWSTDRKAKYCSGDNPKHLISEKNRAREAIETFAHGINGWKISDETRWVFNQLPMQIVDTTRSTKIKGKARKAEDREEPTGYPAVQLIVRLAWRHSRRIVDTQPQATWDQVLQLLPDFVQVGHQFLMADLERRHIRGEDITAQHEWIYKGQVNQSYIPKDSRGLISKMMLATWTDVFRKRSKHPQWDDGYDHLERPMSHFNLSCCLGHEGLKRAFDRAELTPTQQRYLFAYLEGKVGEHETDGSISDIAKWMGCSPANVSQNLERAFQNLLSARLEHADKDVPISFSGVEWRWRVAYTKKAWDKEMKDREAYRYELKYRNATIDAMRDYFRAIYLQENYPTDPVPPRKSVDWSQQVASPVEVFDPMEA